MGTLNDSGVKFDPLHTGAQCNRVLDLEGHLEAVQVELKKKSSPEEIIKAWQGYQGKPQELRLPSAPDSSIVYFEEEHDPQPRLHRLPGNGMAISVARLRRDTIVDYRFVPLFHNTIRGAAGGTILCAELLKAKGLIL